MTQSHNMALPGHSPQLPFFAPGSPPRSFNGSGHPEAQLPPPFQRQMLPPSSPQHFQHRYPQAPPPPPPPPVHAPTFGPQNETRSLPAAPKRPGSSMSISSLLGNDADKPVREQSLNIPQRTPSHHPSTSAPAMSLGAVMSPPQHLSRPNNGEYVYKPRSRTPDRTGFGGGFGARQHRSSSGTMMHRPGPFDGQAPMPTTQTHMPQHGVFASPAPAPPAHLEEAAERVRRTSISGILQRPSSQPQPLPNPRASPLQQSPFESPWGHPPPINPDRVEQNQTNGFASSEVGQNYGNDALSDATRQNGGLGAYDTRPPSFGPPRQSLYGMPESQNQVDRAISQPVSPEGRRAIPESSSNRGFAGLLNGHPGSVTGFRTEHAQNETYPMSRQDSTQSQSERSTFADRLDRGRGRFFSPFASSVGQQPNTIGSAPPEEQSRKGSDESSQHRAILSLAAEAKRGRFSPLPQAVQGAQAQTPVPDVGIKTEHGRVFSGIGSGIPTASSGHGSAPPGLSASPFKRDEGLPRLSEDNLMKISRSTPGTNKRQRRLKDTIIRADSDTGEVQLGVDSAKRRKEHHHHHHQHYELEDLEDLNPLLKPGQRSIPVASLATIRRTPTPAAGAGNPRLHHHHVHHHHHRQPRNTQSTASTKPRRAVRINNILQAVSHNPRRHLGSFVYRPRVFSLGEDSNPYSKLKISIQPPLLPVFDTTEQLNCTYTIRVSRTWLGHDEREAIRAQRFLWGTGVYTDDSDPVMAAMHAGFLKAAWGNQVDPGLLDLGKASQPTIESGQENVPDEPAEPPPGMDLHITLLVLPLLEQYHSTGRFGTLSRKWEKEWEQHDGVSFMVLGAKFVDEGASRGKGRTGKDRKARINAMLMDREETKKKYAAMLKEEKEEEKRR